MSAFISHRGNVNKGCTRCSIVAYGKRGVLDEANEDMSRKCICQLRNEVYLAKCKFEEIMQDKYIWGITSVSKTCTQFLKITAKNSLRIFLTVALASCRYNISGVMLYITVRTPGHSYVCARIITATVECGRIKINICVAYCSTGPCISTENMYTILLPANCISARKRQFDVILSAR